MKSSLKKAQKSAVELAKKKAGREQRPVVVHRGHDKFYVTPEEKVADWLSEWDVVERFEPESAEGDTYSKQFIRNYDNLETGDRVLSSEGEVHKITEMSTRQIITNTGEKFRRSDGVEWGGGNKSITHKLKENQ